MEERRKLEGCVFWGYTCLREIAGTTILWSLFNRISKHKMLNLIAAYGLAAGIDNRLYEGFAERVLTNEFNTELREAVFGYE